jgi:tetratricopeptide (TPR) repeat protein
LTLLPFYVSIEKFKQFDDALSSLKACLVIRRQILGLSHVDVAKTLRELGNVHRAKGHYQYSLSCFKECLRIMSNDVEAKDDINIAHILKDVSETLIQQDKLNQASYCLSEATEIYNSQNHNNQHLGKCFGLLGHVYSSRGDISSATQYYELSIVSFLKNPPQGKRLDVEANILFFPSILHACATMHEISGNEAAATKKYISKFVLILPKR